MQVGLIIGEGVLQFTLIAFVGYFFYRDGAALVEALRNALNRVAGELTERLLDIVGGTINGVVYGIVGTGLAQASWRLIGFPIAGVPGALMLAFAHLHSVDRAGRAAADLGAAPPCGSPTRTRPDGRCSWRIWGFFVISGIDNIVKPLLISRGASLPFVLVLLGVFGGVLAFGFVGIFLGPTLLAVGFNLVRRWTEARSGEQPPP